MTSPLSVPSSTVRFCRTADGARLAWAESGHGAPLVRTAHWMTHVELDMASPLWGPWLQRLSRRLRLVRYDGRGFGSSDRSPEPPTLESAVVDLDAVVQASGHERVSVLGVSSGAATAVAWAARHPERVDRLVLLGGFACGSEHHALSAEQRELQEATLKLMALGWGKRNLSVQQYFTTTMLPGASAEQARSLNEQQRQSCDGAQAAALMRLGTVLDVRAELAQLRCPVLVLHAARDAMVPLELGRDLAARIPGARFQTLDTANHVPLAGEPAFEAFCVAVESFIGAPTADAPPLTPRQRDLLECVAQGLDNRQIAARLGVADKSVRNALSRLYEALQVEGRPQAIVKGRALGFGEGSGQAPSP